MLWIVLLIVVAVVGIMSLQTCVNTRTTVNYSELYAIIDEFDEVENATFTKEQISNNSRLGQISKALSGD